MTSYAVLTALVLPFGLTSIAAVLHLARLAQPSGVARVFCRVGFVWGAMFVGGIATLTGIAMLIPPI